MRIVVIADTHGGHARLGTLEGYVLIHCGDLEYLFGAERGALDALDDWFGRQRFRLILCTGGNHSLEFERRVKADKRPLKKAVYLQDAGVEFGGLTFWRAPWVPDLKGHAFFADETALAEAWAGIPSDVDVLVTHTPPAGILDVSSRAGAPGCPRLAARLEGLDPVLHCFGHVHASVGNVTIGDTKYVNASLVNRQFEIVHRPSVAELPDRTVHRMNAGYGG